MTAAMIIAAALLALLVGALLGRVPAARRRRPTAAAGPPVRHILLPFTGYAISRRAVDAALRLAHAENAVLMPAFLARVPMTLPIDAPVPQQCSAAMPLFEAIEQRAHDRDVQVDPRVGRGRSYRDALRRLLAAERYDRVIVPAGAAGERGAERRRPRLAAGAGARRGRDRAPGSGGPAHAHRRRRPGPVLST